MMIPMHVTSTPLNHMGKMAYPVWPKPHIAALKNTASIVGAPYFLNKLMANKRNMASSEKEAWNPIASAVNAGNRLVEAWVSHDNSSQTPQYLKPKL